MHKFNPKFDQYLLRSTIFWAMSTDSQRLGLIRAKFGRVRLKLGRFGQIFGEFEHSAISARFGATALSHFEPNASSTLIDQAMPEDEIKSLISAGRPRIAKATAATR